MHDPMVVVFEIRRPWPTRSSGHTDGRWKLHGVFWTLAGRSYYWPSLITVWHNEPKGRDSGSVCKGMRGSGLSLHNAIWAAKHFGHLSVQVQPYLRVKRWLFIRCDECGYRFFWKQPRFGYMNGGTYHDKCMSLRTVQGQLDDLTHYVQFDADFNQKFRAEYRLKHLDEKASA